MVRKIYVINNGLKDLRGHYFETSVSIAEAARSLGLRPVLAAHVTCPRDIVPEWLEFYPVFTTDHHVSNPPHAAADLHGLRGELAPLFATPIERLRGGSISFEEYLTARFVAERTVARPAPLRRREQIQRIARAILPPALQRLIPTDKAILRQILPPVVLHRIREMMGKTPRHGEATPSSADRLAIQLGRINALQESDYTQRFRNDLERLLALTGCRPDDHVFLPTAHGRELCAIQQLLQSLPPAGRPTFYLEFRHSLDLTGCIYAIPGEEHPYYTKHRVFFDHARSFPPSDRLLLYSDTEILSEEYVQFSGMEFGVLPIPFRARLIRGRDRTSDALCIAYFGDVRDEKGFHWLPDLVDALMEDFVRTHRVRFLIQASLVSPDYEPRSKAALERLKGYPEEDVRLVGLGGPLSPESYYQLVSEADLLLCPYHPATYRSRSSGTFTEAVAAGIPTVVPQDTWLTRQQPAGSGEAFVDRGTFIDAVRRICENYPIYRYHAEASKHSWLSLHSPELLVQALTGGVTNERKTRPCQVA